MTSIQPLDDRIVIEVLEAEERTAGGIVLPDTAKEKPQRGKVTAVGAGRLLKSGKRAAIQLKVGDQILFGKYAGTRSPSTTSSSRSSGRTRSSRAATEQRRRPAPPPLTQHQGIPWPSS
jgi:chaperonin GroES